MTGASSRCNDAAAGLRERTAAVEARVRDACAEHLAPSFPEKLAVLAVGGFGRRELFPHSDVDLLLLVERESLAELHRAAILEFLQKLWDSGLRVSHSVRTPAECCELYAQNIELNVSLLDQRFLAGDEPLYQKLNVALPRFLHGQRHTLARHLCRLARDRYARHTESIYQLEPNVKESPGGLRDYQLIRWLGQLRGVDPPAPPELDAARDFLFSVRCFLHARAGRDHNLLSFEAQEEAAGADPAAWMREYYRHARSVHRAAMRSVEAAEEQASSLLVQFREWRSRVSNAEFSVSRERVYFRAPHQIGQDPGVVLRLFHFVARHGLRLAVETERRIAENLPALREHFAAGGGVWPALNVLLSLPHAVAALRTMEDSGVLGALLPEWQRIECLPIRDFYHRYTVDEHTLRAIQVLEDLSRRAPEEDRRFADLAAEIDDPGVLWFALLFHDTGKSGAPGKHVAESVRLARQAGVRLGMPERDRQTVATLIEHHLDLSAVLNTRDLDEPSTARLLGESIGTLEILKRLVLLTYADISAVNPLAMTPWRRDQLWRLYLVTYNELTRELETDRIAGAPAADADRAAFLEGFPVRYLRVHSDAEIEAHAQLEKRARERGVALEIEKKNGVYRLTLAAHDRPFLLASIAGALASFGMNILKAEGYANRRRTVLDSFVFSDPLRALELNPPEMDRLRVTLERVTLGKVEVEKLLGKRPRPALPSKSARITPAVSFDAEASESATLIQIVAEDRPGLLFHLAQAISRANCNVELVLADTEAHKALDVFYVTSGGRKLTAAEQEGLQKVLVAACGEGLPG